MAKTEKPLHRVAKARAKAAMRKSKKMQASRATRGVMARKSARGGY